MTATVTKTKGLWSIAKENGVKVSDLYKANPGLKDMQKKGTIPNGYKVTIPDKNKVTTPKSKSKSTSKKNVKKHTKSKANETVSKEVKSNCKCKQCVVDEYGFICQVDDKKVIKNHITKSEHGTLKKVNAIVLHRSKGKTLSWERIKLGIAAHFYIDKDGKIYQVANLRKITWHIGRIKSRVQDNYYLGKGKKVKNEHTTYPEMKNFHTKMNYKLNIWTKAEKKKIEGYGWSPRKVYNNEKTKKYPERYPYNMDAVGIELIGDCTNISKGIWESVTQKQKDSLKKLYKCLIRLYNLDMKKDTYLHEQISRKTLGEGIYVWESIQDLF